MVSADFTPGNYFLSYKSNNGFTEAYWVKCDSAGNPDIVQEGTHMFAYQTTQTANGPIKEAYWTKYNESNNTLLKIETYLDYFQTLPLHQPPGLSRRDPQRPIQFKYTPSSSCSLRMNVPGIFSQGYTSFRLTCKDIKKNGINIPLNLNIRKTPVQLSAGPINLPIPGLSVTRNDVLIFSLINFEGLSINGKWYSIAYLKRSHLQIMN